MDHRDLEEGDELTFFYPSTEWDMAQGFECKCDAGKGVCKGTIDGAGKMGRDRLRGYWLNGYIAEMLDEMENSRLGMPTIHAGSPA